MRLRDGNAAAWCEWVLAAVLLLAAATVRADDAPPAAVELKLSVAVGSAYALGEAADGWAQRIAEHAGGRLAPKVFPGATLAARDPAREFAALRDGAADLAVGSTLYWSDEVPALRVVGLPWLAPEPAQLDALASGAVADALFAAMNAAGVVPLALAPLGHRELALGKRAARTPEDLAGLKVRIAATKALTPLYGALGAQPLTMPFAAAQAALSAGTIDAQDGTPAMLAGMRADMLGMKWLLQWSAVAELAVFAVNRARWDRLDEAQRTLLRESAIATAHELAEGARRENEAALEHLRKGGMTVIRLTSAGRAPFAAATRAAYDAQAAQAGADLVRAAEAAVKGAPQ